MQEKRHQMMNDVRALCSISDPNLVQLIGAYHAPEKGQVLPGSQSSCGMQSLQRRSCRDTALPPQPLSCCHVTATPLFIA